MTALIKMLHFADVHVGMENYGHVDPQTGISSRVQDFLNAMDQVLFYAVGHKADLAVFAGDAFKTRNPDPTQLREFVKRVRSLALHMPVLLLAGNHDMPGMAARATSVDVFETFDEPGVIVANRAGSKVVETAAGPVFLAWLPYPMRSRLGSQSEERDLKQITTLLIDDLAEEAEKHDMPRVFVGHFTVDLASVGAERSLMLGRDVAVSKSTLDDDRWDYVALGHIHKHQDVNAGKQPPIVYSGSLERIDFGEEAEPKGFCMVDLVREDTTWEFIKIEARPFTTIDIDVRDAADVDDIRASIDGDDWDEAVIKDAVVRVRIQMLAGQADQINDRELTDLLHEASFVTISRVIDHEARMRLETGSVETMTPVELLERYLSLQDLPPDKIERALEKGKELINDPQ